MVFICGGLGIILHLAWLACLFFIMDEQSVPVHSVPVSNTVHLPLPVPETTPSATMVQPTCTLVQEHESDCPHRAQCIVKRFQKRVSTQPTPSLEQSASPPSVDAFQQAVDTFISGTDSASLQQPGPEGPLLPPSPSYDADFEWIASVDRIDEPASSGDTSGADSWHLLSGTSVTSTTIADAVPEWELSPLRTGRLLFDTSPAGALPIAASFIQEAQVDSMHPSQISPTIPDAPSISGKPLARPAALRVETSRAKSLHSHPVRTSQHARLRPVVHLKASVGNPVACPKPRPVPSARGAYASYPSLTTSWGKQAEGATSKSSPHVKAPVGMDTSCPLPSAARLLGAATGSQKRSVSFIPETSSGSSNKVIKHSDVHSQHWTRALHLWCELCELTSACSRLLQDILHSDNRHALLEQLLRRVSDNTALRYIAVLWQLFTTVKDLELEISSLSQVQLVDAIHTLQRSRSHHASLHSLNVLKAIRWFASTVQPDGFPSLYQGLFHSKAWQSSSMRKEAIPLPLAFVLWLETELVFERLSRPEAVFAGSVLLCIWCSLRFSDAQHVRLEQFFIDFDSIRSISYRTKSRKFMPFGCISGGLYRLPSHHSWLFHWLSAMEHALELNSSSAAAPDYIFFGFDGASVRPLSYAEALVRLRRMLDMWGGITSLQTLQYTLHSMKVTLLAFFRQLDFSLETRHLQGHHTFASSSTLYGRDDVSPLIIAQDSFIARVLQGWRARTPMMRGVTFMPSEPPLVWAQELGSVASIPALTFFRFSEERHQPTVVTSPLAGESDQLHSTSALVPQPALPEVPQVPPLEGETSSGSGEDLGTPEEITFLCAESSCILHAGIAGRPACGCRGTFRAISHPTSVSRFCRSRACSCIFTNLD